MNRLSLKELCGLFCCPPLPSKIAAKLAFLPPEPTYQLIPNATNESPTNVQVKPSTLQFFDRAEWQYTDRELESLEAFTITTNRNNQIACLYVKATPQPKFHILFSHGNAVDIGQMSSFYLGLGSRLQCNILGYDYSGYGCSTGCPSEKNLYSDAESAWDCLRIKYNLSSDKIIMYGQSIGTVPTVDLAARHSCAGVILHSPLTSGMRVAFPETNRTWCFDAFPSIEKIERVMSKVLVIHGMEDEVVDFSHGMAIYSKAVSPVEPLWLEGAGHNDIELHAAYLERLKKFINEDLIGTHQNNVDASKS